MKTTIDVDREVAAEAAEILGTKTLKQTVNAALREVVQAELRRQLAEDVLAARLSVPTIEELADLRAPKGAVGALESSRKTA